MTFSLSWLFSTPSDTSRFLWSVLCCCWVAKLCLTLCDCMDCSMPSFSVLHYLPELAQTHVRRVSGAIQPSHLLSSPSLPVLSLFQHQGLFQWAGSSHQVARLLELQLQHQSFQWIFRLILFRIDWFDLLAVPGTLKSFLQHYSSKVSILQQAAFFMVQLSHMYMTSGKDIALTTWIFVGKVMCLLFNRLPRFVIAFLPRNKCLFISSKYHTQGYSL